MEKLQAIHIKEQQEKRRFKETLRLRNELISLKSQIEEAENQNNVAEKEFKKLEPKVFDMELEVKTLEAQRDNMEIHVRGRIMNVLGLEETLNQSKASFQNNMHQFIDITNNLIEGDSLMLQQHSFGTDMDQSDETSEIRKQVWTLQGEIEAMKFYKEVQNRRIKEIGKIKEVVGEPFQGEMEDNGLKCRWDKEMNSQD